METTHTVAYDNNFTFTFPTQEWGIVEFDKDNKFKMNIRYKNAFAFTIIIILYFTLFSYTLVTETDNADVILESFLSFVPITTFFAQLLAVLYNTRTIPALMDKLQENELPCSKNNPDESNEIYKKYASRANKMCRLWLYTIRLSQMCIRDSLYIAINMIPN